jgi:translation initiation factor 2B subunit (eIF-2B alpha/beta/delta family)
LFGTNGINLKGEVSHGLGHLAIADMSKEHGIPVYVIAESLKIGKDNAEFKRNPKNRRRETWYPTDVLFDDINESNNHNPREDIVPPNKITGIITERGSAIREKDADAFPIGTLKKISLSIEDAMKD